MDRFDVVFGVHKMYICSDFVKWIISGLTKTAYFSGSYTEKLCGNVNVGTGLNKRIKSHFPNVAYKTFVTLLSYLHLKLKIENPFYFIWEREVLHILCSFWVASTCIADVLCERVFSFTNATCTYQKSPFCSKIGPKCHISFNDEENLHFWHCGRNFSGRQRRRQDKSRGKRGNVA